MDDFSKYEEVRAEAEKFYSSLKPIYSPALNENISFTPEGFNHLIFKGVRLERDRNSQILRFNLLALGVRLIGISTTYQEFEEVMREFEVKSFKKRTLKNKYVRYWGIIAIIDGKKIKVVIRKIGDGATHFWSIIPSWTTSRHRDIKFFSTMEGNPEED